MLQHTSWSILAQILVWCLLTPSLYLNQCVNPRLIVGIHPSVISQKIQKICLQNIIIQIILIVCVCPRAQCNNSPMGDMGLIKHSFHEDARRDKRVIYLRSKQVIPGNNYRCIKSMVVHTIDIEVWWYIYASDIWVISSTVNGLSSVGRQAITWSHAE